MNQGEVVKALLVEIDGTTEKLRRALRDGGIELEKFEGKAKQSNTRAGGGTDVLASKQATAARNIAMVTETMARQGKVSGETAKQVINQASSMAFAFGPQGALVGAIGISTLAIVSMFARVKREAAEAAEATAREFAKVSRLGLGASTQRLAEINTGSFPMREALAGRGGAISREQALAAARLDFSQLGLAGLGEERARQMARRDELAAIEQRMRAEDPGSLRLWLNTEQGRELAQVRKDLEAIAQATRALEAARPVVQATVDRNIAQAGERAATELSQAQQEARARDREELAKRGRELSAQADRIQEEIKAKFEKTLSDGFAVTAQTSAADITSAFDELERFAEEHGEQGMLDELRTARDHALQLVDLLGRASQLMGDAEFASLMDDIAATEDRGLTGAHAARIQEMRTLRDEAIALSNQEGISEEQRTQFMQQAIKLQAQINALIKEADPEVKQVTRSFAEQAKEIARVVDGALQLAGAMGGVRRETLDVLRGIVSIATALPSVGESWQRFRNAGTATNALALGGDLLQLAGGIASVIGSVFGTSPAERERRRVQRENTQAIEALTREVGLFALAMSGTQFTEGRTELDALFARRMRVRIGASELDGRVGDLPDSFRLDWSQFRDLDRQALEALAASLGVTLDGTVGSFRRLQEALDAAEGKLAEFTDSFADRRTVDRARMDLMGITDPIERVMFGSRAARDMSPALAAAFEGLDLQNAEDRAELNKRLLALIDLMEAGGDSIGEEGLGGLNPQEFLDTVLEIWSGLEGVGTQSPGTSLGGISGFRGLTEAAGERMADYQRELVSLGREASSQRQRMVDALDSLLMHLTVTAGSPVSVPDASVVLGARAGGAGAAQILIGPIDLGGVHITVERGTSPDLAAEAAMRVIGESVEQVLYDALVRAKKVAGDLSVVRRIR